ncbi:CHAT domain-containing protein [Roseofilum sp. BLCC_M91]|uniref:CHAT domain-containing protein n=1 Tax=Roseofilum halophilum BLCC-M91 TaxID=3022259 RepID=A0ABT7BES1_9CYAN|nr:CHAT domain-containing protein [Roseofilum halophilum]MDJ1177678.1 CHAT domain-containing protein [Roseofilum halophilum BLCC-M91]
MKLNTFTFLTTSATLLSLTLSPLNHKTLAQNIVPAMDGTGTIINHQGNQFNIQGGQLSGNGRNLFHSFQQLGLSQGQIANFMSNPQIQNILGRINGGDPSIINGLIQVTGGNSNLYLMNPAGIVFGPNAQLNIPADFAATTATGIGFGNGQWFNAVGDNNWSQLVGTPNEFRFDVNGSGSIVNFGDLKLSEGSNLTLMGANVINLGTLEAPGGTITVVAIPDQQIIRITQEGHLLSLDIPLEDERQEPEITPLKLPELLTHSGLDHAEQIQINEQGQIVLSGSGVEIPDVNGISIISGTVNTSAENGGTINIMAERIGVIDATLDASGLFDGGTLRIGGDFKGNPTFPTADITYINENSILNAGSQQLGDGGNIFIWSENLTRFDGQISATGGIEGGDGGFAEISSRNALRVDGDVDLSAINGDTGQVLFDPKNVTIVDGADGANDSELEDSKILWDEDPDADWIISEEKLEEIWATSDITIEATNNITIEDLSDNILGGSKYTLTFVADADKDGQGSFAMDAGDSIDTNGSVDISGAGLRLGTIYISSAVGDSGDITLNSSNTIEAERLSTYSEKYSAGDITIQSEGDVFIRDRIMARAEAKLTNHPHGGNVEIISQSGNITITNEVNTSSGILTNNPGDGGDITIRSVDGYIETGEITSSVEDGKAGNIVLEAGEHLTVDKVLAFAETAGNGGHVTITAGEDVQTARIATGTIGSSSGDNNGGNVEITSENGTVTTDSIITGVFGNGDGGHITISSYGDIRTEELLSGTLSGTPGDITITSENGSFTIESGLLRDYIISRCGGSFDCDHSGDTITFARDLEFPGQIVPIAGKLSGTIEISLGQANSNQQSGGGSSSSSGSTGNQQSGGGSSSSGGSTDPQQGGDSSSSGGSTDPQQGGDSSSSGGSTDNQQAGDSSSSGGSTDNQQGGDSSSSGGSTDNQQGGDSSGSGGSTDNQQAGDSSSDSTATQQSDDSSSSPETITKIIEDGNNNPLEITGVVFVPQESNSTNPDNSIPENQPELAEIIEEVQILINPEFENPALFLPTLLNNAGNVNIQTATGIGIGTSVSSSFVQGDGGDFTGRTDGAVQAANIDTSARDGDGGNIMVEGVQGVATGDLNSSSSYRGDGGNIQVSSPQSSVTIGNIDSSTNDGNSGDVGVRALGNITTEDIDTSSNQGNAGDVSLNSQTGTVSTGLINTAAPQGIPGTVTIESNATPVNSPVNQSVNPSVTQSVIQPQIPVNPPLTPLTSVPPVSVSVNPNIPGSSNVTVTTDLTDLDRFAIDLASLNLELGGLQETWDQRLQELDQLMTEEYSQYVKKDPSEIVTIAGIKDMLSTIEAQTGNKPAVVYALSHPNVDREGIKLEGGLVLVLVTSEGVAEVETVQIDRFFGHNVSNKPERIATAMYNELEGSRHKAPILATAQKAYKAIIAPLEEQMEAQGIDTLMFSVDNGLRSIPLGMLHDGEQFLIEKYNIALIPSVTLTNSTYEGLENARVLAMGASEFPNAKRDPLPSVPLELEMIGSGNWHSDRFLNQDFTLENMKTQRLSRRYDIVHLATHADFDSRDSTKLEFWDRTIALETLRDFDWHEQPQVELLVLSACQTAIGDLDAELGFAGLAVRAGVKSSVASLWKVDDLSTVALMTAFYEYLQTEPIKAEALRQAQLAMLRGEIFVENGELVTPHNRVTLPATVVSQLKNGDRSLSHPFHWAGFTVVGSPW